MKSIVFVGDSFCNAIPRDVWVSNGRNRLQHECLPDVSFIDIISKHCNAQPIVHGYGGRSWWYSWTRFVDYVKKFRLDDIEAVIFCHTEPNRLPNAWNDFISVVSDPKMVLPEDAAVREYYKYLVDEAYNDWAMQRYFEFIHKYFQPYPHIKIINFNCFPISVPWSNLLPGVVFTTPLMHIATGGLTGSKDEILTQFNANETNDNRLYNHLTVDNNKALAQVIISELDNYTPGIKELPLEQFNLPNSNFRNWPDDKYWTK